MASEPPPAICNRKVFRILKRRYSNRLGEIDLIAVDGSSIVFVEVKTRHSDAAGHPTEAVDARKQKQLTRAALVYLKYHNLLEHPARFDVVSVLWPKGVKRPEIAHYRNAFSPSGRGNLYS